MARRVGVLASAAIVVMTVTGSVGADGDRRCRQHDLDRPDGGPSSSPWTVRAMSG